MAISMLRIIFLISLLFALIFRLELDKLTSNSKIHSLESLVEKKNQELESKDETIAEKEKAIAEKDKTIIDKSHIITSLKDHIASLEVKGSVDANEQVKKAHTRFHELEKQVERLQMEIKLKDSLREALEAGSQHLEKKTFDLNSKLHDSYAESHWKEHGKHAFESLKQKVSFFGGQATEKKAQAERWAGPHVQTVKSKWIPAARERWVLTVTNVEAQLQSLTKKTKEVYIQSKDALTRDLSEYMEAVDSHFQAVEEVSELYIGQISTATKHHLDKAWETAAPYTNEAVIAYGKVLESATKCWKLIVDRK